MLPRSFRATLHLLLPALAAAGLAVVPVATSSGAAAPAQRPIFHCDGEFTGITVKHVRVAPGDTCVLRDSLVTGNFMARRPHTVKVLDTEVRRNVMVRGATHDVVIGNAGCRLDPVVGNNIKVSGSHNVVICWMSTKNNIQVTGNDGRISLFHNNAGRNISVSRNDAYVADPGVKHRNPGAIRIRDNVAGGHIQLFNNDPSRKIFGKSTNTPLPVVR